MGTLAIHAWAREDLLYFPPAFATLSLVYVSLRALHSWLQSDGKTGVSRPDTGEHLHTRGYDYLWGIIKKLDGGTILFFRLLRLSSILALVALEAFGLRMSPGNGSSARVLQTPFFAYLSIIAIASIFTPPRWRDIASLQLALLLFADAAVYFILDIWPYVMITPIPFEPLTEPTTRVRLTLLALSGIIIPLVMPRPSRSSLDEEPSAEEIASLLSRYSYSYLDKIIFRAYRSADITIEDIPHIPEHRRIEALAMRTLASLDPVQAGKRHAIWGSLRIWAKEYAALQLCMFLYILSEFVGPLATHNLLEYLESGIPTYGLHPWVWIVLLVLEPLVSAGLYTQFLYVFTRVIIETSNAFRYLVFHHALRIRLKADSLDSEANKDELISAGEDESTMVPGIEDSAEASQPQADAATTSIASDGSSPMESLKDNHFQEKTSHLIGKINNLVTSDASAVSSVIYINNIPTALLQLAISVTYLYNLLGWSAFVGLAVMLLFSPLPVYLGRLMVNVQQDKMKSADKRVQAVAEALGIIRMIKLFGWEPYVFAQLAHHREEELAKLRRFRILDIAMNAANHMYPIFSKVIVISIYTLSSKGEISASRIFAALMIFTMMDEQLSRVIYTLPSLLQSKVAYDRFTQFLNSTELLSEGNGLSADAMEQPGHDMIGFKECTFSWNSFVNSEMSTRKNVGRKHFNLRIGDEIIFKRGQINIIVGPTASGKTSVLMALLGEMYYKPHGLGSWYNLPRDGGIAYAPQETWVLNETIKENILFGEPYNEERYKKVLRQCALEKDLALWEAGDQTEVGEKGLTLSGGQKARVTLARALYSSASILLLDDVLAALDVHTAKWIVEEALQGELIQGRTVLLVTHNITLVSPVADYVTALTHHGTITAQGPVSEVLKWDSQLRQQVEKEREILEEDIETKLDEGVPGKEIRETGNSKKTAGKLVISEEKALGRVEMAAIMLYITSMGGPFIWSIILGTRLLGTAIMILQTWFMGFWSNQYESHPASEVPVLKYLILFALANVVGQLIDSGASQVVWQTQSIRASKVIHARLLHSVVTASFRWLDITPAGRIITRCTQDMSTIDDQFGNFANAFLSSSLNVICLFFSSVVMAGWYALISGALITFMGVSIGRVYLKSQLGITREMSNARAPVMSHIGTVLAGLPSIRAYNAQSIFRDALKKHIDLLIRTSYCSFDVNRWVSIRMDSLGAIFSGVVATYIIYGSRVQAGYAGFTLSVVLAFSRQILGWVRYYNSVEVEANSLERVLDYLRIDHEPESSESGNPPAYWPSSGDLRVEKLSARYSDDSPTVLNDISFIVKSGERVGVVGRTGAGKSSIALSLLRAIKTDGKVYYDGLPTDEINLDALRANITLIPQQPELINGTLRENLDPFGQHDDATLNDALNASGFFSIKDLDTKHQSSNGEQSISTAQNSSEAEQSTNIGLDTMVESGGTNFSLGQRQIIALARAIVRRSKLLILDEATAAIDYDTDATIQKTLRTEFSKHTTLLTIAHRLRTIIDYDKIMVLDAGQLVEFDNPRNLMRKNGGYFRSLVDESNDRELLLKLLNGQ